PYVNNIPHLGNLTQVLSADVFARFCRSKGYETLYICGTDEYGTATETRALQEGITPQELCDRFYSIHRDIYQWFGIDFDHFGRTSTPLQTEIVQEIFHKVDAAGYINEHEVEQLYCPSCERYLADRFVEGTCPKCGYEQARGDQCDNCQSLLDPIDLINPRCGICATTPVAHKTKHLYIDLPKALPLLEAWMEKASVDGFWAHNAVQMTRSWIRDGLKERAITRDLKWGIPVPKAGYEDKVFYVWFDAPIGYISITANHTDDWKSWWKNPSEVELFQFIGKDNIPFHTVIFPSCLLATGEDWTMLHHMSSTEYLNYESGKFSKSLGVGIFGNDVQETGIPADVWRFYIFLNRPEKSDVTFSWSDFQERVNGELIGNLSNLVNRTLTFAKRYYPDGEIFDAPYDEELLAEIRRREERIDAHLERAEERDALRQVLALSSLGNKSFQDNEPWKLRSSDPERTKSLLRTLVLLIRDLGILIEPFMPTTSAEILGFVESPESRWTDLGSTEGPKAIGEVKLLFTKLEDEQIAELRERYSGTQADRALDMENEMEVETQTPPLADRFAERVVLKVGKITEVERHPNGDRLYILHLDMQEEEERIIVSSIVPFYEADELDGRNIVVVSNLKPARFRGVKSNGMLLAAGDPDAEPHSTCEVIFADEFAPGTVLQVEGYPEPELDQPYLKADHFFEMEIKTEAGTVTVDGKPIGHDGKHLSVKTYLDGVVN
ncbi:MAG TPA: methionine--tRNA ligase, partial [Sphaerochaeta sp.]|nr:methionine--tRNA ligase [Sphaerochaeta sp.]